MNSNNKLDLKDLYEEINKLKEKISCIEKDNFNKNQILIKELERAKNVENNTIINDVNIMKKRQDQFEGAMLRDFAKFKNDILNDINLNNTNLLQNFENMMYNNNLNQNIENMENENNENNNKEDNKNNDNRNNNNNNIGDELFKENINYINHNYSIDSIKSNYIVKKENNKNQKSKPKSIINQKKIEEMMNKEFSQYRTELNKNVVKLSLLEKKYNGLSEQYYKDIKDINDNIKLLNNYQKNFEEFQNNTISNLKNFKDDFRHNVDNNKLFISEISKIIEDFQRKLNFYENNFIKVSEQYMITKNNLDDNFKSLAQKINNELNEFHISINSQVAEQGQEIEIFEKYISQEHEKFVKFIQTHFDEQISSIKKLFDFNGDDIKKLNEKIEIIQEIIKKVRNDVFKSISDSEEFMENKYQSLFRLINKE